METYNSVNRFIPIVLQDMLGRVFKFKWVHSYIKAENYCTQTWKTDNEVLFIYADRNHRQYIVCKNDEEYTELFKSNSRFGFMQLIKYLTHKGEIRSGN